MHLPKTETSSPAPSGMGGERAQATSKGCCYGRELHSLQSKGMEKTFVHVAIGCQWTPLFLQLINASCTSLELQSDCCKKPEQWSKKSER